MRRKILSTDFSAIPFGSFDSELARSQKNVAASPVASPRTATLFRLAMSALATFEKRHYALSG